MIKPAIIFFICSMLLNTGHFLHSQDIVPLHRLYTTSDGLPSSEVYRVLQDKNGYMWFATDNGLSRFDGYEFKNYGTDEGLTDVVVISMTMDSDGVIWLVTISKNLFYYDPDVDSIQLYKHNDIIWDFKYDYRLIEKLIYNTDTQVLTLMLGDLGFLKIEDNGNFEMIKCNETFVMCILKDGDKLISTQQTASDRFTTSSELTRLTREEKMLPIHIISKEEYIEIKNPPIIQTPELEIPKTYSYILDDNILYFNYSDHHYFIKEDSVIHYRTGVRTVRLIKTQDQKYLSADSYGRGLSIYDSLNDLLRNIPSTKFFEDHIISDFIQDVHGSFWITTLDAGVIFVPNFENFLIKIRDEPKPVNDVVVMDHRLYLVDDNLRLLTAELNKKPVLEFSNLHSSVQFKKLFSNNRQEKLYGSDLQTGLVQISPSEIIYYHVGGDKMDKLIKDTKFDQGAYSHVPMKNMSFSKEGTVLNLAAAGEFVFVNETKLTVDHYRLRRDLGRVRTFDVFEDTNSKLWVADLEGLWSLENDSLISQKSIHPSFEYRVEDLDQLPKGNMVAGTKGSGIIIWNNDEVLQINEADGLTSNMIENLSVDEKENLWVGTSSGANMISFNNDNTYQIIKFTVQTGLPSNEINRIAFYKDQTFLATFGGLVMLRDLDLVKASPGPIIEHFSSSEQSFSLEDKLSIPYAQNDISLSFVTLNYHMSSDIEYRYKVNDSNWSTTKSRDIRLLNLAPDAYNFEIQSMNQNGIWSDSTTLDFVIESPWWQTLWFRILSALSLLGVIFSVFRYRTNQLKKESELSSEIKELERSALNAQMNPHFIFNCLNSIQNYIVNNQKELATEYLAKFAGLIRMSLNSTTQKESVLDQEILIIQQYLALEKLRFKQLFNYEINVDENLNPMTIAIPPLLIQPIVENAIVHGISSRTEGGLVSIHIYKKEESLLIVEVCDNGSGLKEDSNNGKGLSISVGITKRRLELLDKLERSNSLTIENILDLDGTIRGVKAILSIDLKERMI